MILTEYYKTRTSSHNREKQNGRHFPDPILPDKQNRILILQFIDLFGQLPDLLKITRILDDQLPDPLASMSSPFSTALGRYFAMFSIAVSAYISLIKFALLDI